MDYVVSMMLDLDFPVMSEQASTEGARRQKAGGDRMMEETEG